MDGIKLGNGVRVALGVIPGVVGIVVFVWLAFAIFPGGQLNQNIERLEALGVVVVALGIGFGVVALLRFAMVPLLRPATAAPSADADSAIRNRIAPLVLAIGSLAIAFLAAALILAFAVLAYHDKDGVVGLRIDTLLTGIFSTVLPVVATWVGTVLAFYFGSENFRQAAQSTREAIGAGSAATKKLSDVMTSYERIARLEASDATDAANNLTMLDVIHTMSGAAPRVIIFDKAKRTPFYIIRSGSPPMPDGWIKPDYSKGDKIPDDPNQAPKIQAYLDANAGRNKADAQSFRFAGPNMTVQDAIALMNKESVDDLFITVDGQPSSRVLGWVTMTDLLAG